jgi:hypothetical protein
MPSNYEIMPRGDGVFEKEKASKLLYNSKCSRRVFCISKPVTNKGQKIYQISKTLLLKSTKYKKDSKKKVHRLWHRRAGSKKANTYHLILCIQMTLCN